MTKATVDIVFSRGKAEEAGGRTRAAGSPHCTAKMDYAQFLFALNQLAARRQTGFQEVVSRILKNVDSRPTPSMADLIIFRADNLDPASVDMTLQGPAGLERPKEDMPNPVADMLAKEAEMAEKLRGGRKDEAKAFARQTSFATFREQMRSASKRASGAGDDVTVYTEADRRNAGGATPSGGGGGGATPDPAQRNLSPAMQAAGATPGSAGGAGADGDDGAALLQSMRASESMRDRWGMTSKNFKTLGEKTGTAALHDSKMLWAARTTLSPDDITMSLKRAFEAYNAWSHGMDRSSMDRVRFAKVMRDAELVQHGGGAADGPTLDPGTVDAIFRKLVVRPKSTINFLQFIEGLREVATILRVSLNEVMERIVVVGGPVGMGGAADVGSVGSSSVHASPNATMMARSPASPLGIASQ